jgi:microcystin-dependent protein
MAYVKNYDAWGAGDPITALAMNHIESQWTEIKAETDVHLHEDRYYNKTLADTTFFSLAYYTGFDADLLDGQHFTDMLANVMPTGAIMIWSGDAGASLPSGWQVCDGSVYGAYTTPDLRGKFVIGAGTTYAIGASGGAFSTTISGSVTVGSHIVSASEMPLHTHTYNDISNGAAGGYRTTGGAYGTGGGDAYYNRTTGATGSAGAHGHVGSTITMNNINATPPWHSLYYIMKVI